VDVPERHVALAARHFAADQPNGARHGADSWSARRWRPRVRIACARTKLFMSERLVGDSVTPKTIDEYLATLSDDKRAALERLRKIIRGAAPRAEECISYQLPAFRLDGRMLVWFGASTKHCSFYPGAVVHARKDELKKYDISKGTIRFQADRPLPATLIRTLVKDRIAANAARQRRVATRAARRR
jgi:uncharacterized protein YdhG (YjbR/CyaY superfamily)